MQLRNGLVVGQNIIQPPSKPLFEEGARLIFAKWTALQLAVANQWGGGNSAEKAELLYQDCLQWFYRKREHYADELEEELDDAIMHDFNVEAEDGSPKQISEAMVRLYQELVAAGPGATCAFLEHLRSMAAAGVQLSKRQVVDLDGTLVEEDADMGSSSEEGSGDEGGSEDGMDHDGDAAPQGVPLQPRAPREPVAPVVDEDGFTMVQKGRKGRR